MNRDAILATIIGFGIGLVVTGAIVFGPQVSKNLPKLPPLTLSNITWPKFSKPPLAPTPTPDLANLPATSGEKLTIDSPLPENIEINSQLLVSGKTKPNSLVVVEMIDEQKVISANGDGKYATQINLSEGKNDIWITSYYQGQPERKTVTVFYTQETW